MAQKSKRAHRCSDLVPTRLARPAINEKLEYLMTAFLHDATVEERQMLLSALQHWNESQEAFPVCMVGSAITGLAAGLPEASTISRIGASIGHSFRLLHNLKLADNRR